MAKGSLGLMCENLCRCTSEMTLAVVSTQQSWPMSLFIRNTVLVLAILLDPANHPAGDRSQCHFRPASSAAYQPTYVGPEILDFWWGTNTKFAERKPSQYLRDYLRYLCTYQFPQIGIESHHSPQQRSCVTTKRPCSHTRTELSKKGMHRGELTFPLTQLNGNRISYGVVTRGTTVRPRDWYRV